MDTTFYTFLIGLIYLAAACCFVIGIKLMAHPRTAVRGNLFGAGGMLLAIIGALFDAQVAAWNNPAGPANAGYTYVVIGAIIGSAIGAWLALKIQMTAMPQLVAIFNGLGGAASVVVAGAYLFTGGPDLVNFDVLLATALSGLIGGVTFSGSLVAYGKLQELAIFDKPIALPGQQIINLVIAIVLLALTVLITVSGPTMDFWLVALLFFVIVALSLVLGVFLTLPIGGADMPVVIALLNSYSGLAAAATGFVILNNVLIVSGSLVGASGIILTQIMCKAMNRSLTNVLFGVMGTGSSGGDDDAVYANVRKTSADDVAMLLDGAQRVVIVPGYGMAVAQAQHAVRDLGNLLEQRGAVVEYAIHPVAGRMPGHMNVLLAEADVSYDKLKEMDEINPTLETVDVAIVIGANDVVNPVAQTDPQSPIAGMPIIEVGKARTVIVIKRSLSPGFAKIPNPLFAADNTLMLFADGRQAVLDIIRAVKEG
ncbi:NAD(P)(+) transhydrogenase (Re/Si-specific) subunit beta [Lignipirellula cremea]|uniref:NAD(P) transhydrogenase subunit beta n=1 Tax=Lignipirellula cremea TaxID=2528010 RepID=A0A518DLV7_9BACT|nr:NAD(P)(+) transhydrogenase (Re/Si-specific) subunit beta [Lignipirellula cremea]QDU92826.1 NAD(P) transhydrogenase subunit beta [Lignipirellula cremea]